MLTPEMHEAIDQLTDEELYSLYSDIAGFEHTPVDITEFLESDRYLGPYFQGQLYPYWKSVFKEIYPNPFDSPYFLVCFRGAIGCVREDTPIDTINGKIPISQINNATLYSTFDGKSQAWSIGSRPFVRGKGIFYRVVTERSEIHVSEGHQLLCSDLKYKTPIELNVGDFLHYQSDFDSVPGVSVTKPNRILAIEKLPPDWFWDIQVLDTNNYISGGAVHHNCGKTSLACAGMAYDLYKLLITDSPQRRFNLVPTTKILFAIFNRTLTLSTDVVWDKMQQMFSLSPFFSSLMGQFGTRKPTDDKTLFPSKRIDFMFGSRMGHSLGHAIHCLHPDTLVLTSQGYRPISSMSTPGPYIIYQQAPDSSLIPTAVPHSYPTTLSSDNLRITFDDNSVIECTPDHQFKDLQGNFVRADSLSPGDHLLVALNTPSLSSHFPLGPQIPKELLKPKKTPEEPTQDPFFSLTVHHIETVTYSAPIQMYCFQVPGHHNFVLENGLVSHNCMVGETEIPLLDGTTRRIDSLLDEEEFWVYSAKQDGEIVPGRGHSARLSGYTDELVEVHLDNGEVVKTTGNHRYMLRDGEYREARDLEVGQSLMPLYFENHARDRYGNYTSVVDNKTGKPVLMHWQVVKHLLGGYKGKGFEAHHVDFNPKNNHPNNIVILTKEQHVELHRKRVADDPEYAKYLESIRISALNKMKSCPEAKRKMSEASKKLWSNPDYVSMKSKELSATNKRLWKDPDHAKRLKPHQIKAGKKAACKFMASTTYEQRVNITKNGRTAGNKSRWQNQEWIDSHREDFARGGKIAAAKVWSNPETVKIIKKGATKGGALSANRIVNWTCPKCGRFFEKQCAKSSHSYRCKNHKVTKVIHLKLDTPVPVYDITVDKYENFAIKQGIFQHNSAVISEANFSSINDQAYESFNSILRRMESRFLTDNDIKGKIWVDSSESDTFSIVNRIVDNYRHSDGVFISQASLWQVKPSQYCGETFTVYKGSDSRRAEIIEGNNHPLLTSEPEAIIEVPIEHKDSFMADLDSALRDLGGHATASSYRLFRNIELLQEAARIPLIIPEIIELDFFDETDQIFNYITNPGYFQNLSNSSSKRCIHLDLATTNDFLGIACCAVVGEKIVEKMDDFTLSRQSFSMPITRHEFAFAIRAKHGQQILFAKVKYFIKQLSQRGFPVHKVSADSWNSADILQWAKLEGYQTETISVDRTPEHYKNFRAAIYNRCAEIPQNSHLVRELRELLVSPDGKKVDHPKKTSTTLGMKDTADSTCGSWVSAQEFAVDAKTQTLAKQFTQKKSVDPILQNLFPGRF